jgi:hypothetical protein
LHLSCCDDQNHLTNRHKRFYGGAVGSLQMQHEGTCEITLAKKHPNYDLRSMSEHDVWGEDPVHPPEEAYKKVAAGAISMLSPFSPGYPVPHQEDKAAVEAEVTTEAWVRTADRMLTKSSTEILTGMAVNTPRNMEVGAVAPTRIIGSDPSYCKL